MISRRMKVPHAPTINASAVRRRAFKEGLGRVALPQYRNTELPVPPIKRERGIPNSTRGADISAV
jgi:hypothetical protein